MRKSSLFCLQFLSFPVFLSFWVHFSANFFAISSRSISAQKTHEKALVKNLPCQYRFSAHSMPLWERLRADSPLGLSIDLLLLDPPQWPHSPTFNSFLYINLNFLWVLLLSLIKLIRIQKRWLYQRKLTRKQYYTICHSKTLWEIRGMGM